MRGNSAQTLLCLQCLTLTGYGAPWNLSGVQHARYIKVKEDALEVCGEEGSQSAGFPGKQQESLVSSLQLHLFLPFSFFTYAQTTDSLGDLYQVQMVKNNLLNTFLDELKSKTILSLVQPSLKG